MSNVEARRNDKTRMTKGSPKQGLLSFEHSGFFVIGHSCFVISMGQRTIHLRSGRFCETILR